MKLINSSEVKWTEFSGHRGEGIQFKKLIQGQPGAPDNFEFSIVRAHDTYHTPRHRHNFDQIRYGLSGSWGYDKGKIQEPGEVGYFPEGVYYEQMGTGKGASDTLLIQCGGASGNGFLSYHELSEGYQELARKGEFAEGVFTWTDNEGKRHNKDGYEAIWEHVSGRPVAYPAPRYDSAILMNPDNYQWRSVPGKTGVSQKHIASFTERNTEITFFHIEEGATLTTQEGRHRLIYILEGDGRLNDENWQKGYAMEFENGEKAELEADAETLIYCVNLPEFDI